MKFVRKNQNIQPYVDTIFSVVQAAKADPEAINATAGCLYDEEGKMCRGECKEEWESIIRVRRTRLSFKGKVATCIKPYCKKKLYHKYVSVT